jgi:hypothetical protein
LVSGGRRVELAHVGHGTGKGRASSARLADPRSSAAAVTDQNARPEEAGEERTSPQPPGPRRQASPRDGLPIQSTACGNTGPFKVRTRVRIPLGLLRESQDQGR